MSRFEEWRWQRQIKSLRREYARWGIDTAHLSDDEFVALVGDVQRRMGEAVARAQVSSAVAGEQIGALGRAAQAEMGSVSRAAARRAKAPEKDES